MYKVSLIFLLLFLARSTQALATSTADELISQRMKHLETFYKDLHQNPELSGEEKRTAERVAAELRSLGLEVIENIGGHGVVGILRNGPGPITLIRSELDGLPIQENTNLAFKSLNSGKMHACGHDFHAAALMGTAYVAVNTKDDWKGTLIFLAQPAEETGKGALTMIKDGLFKKIPKPDHLLALHTSGNYKAGTIGITSGFALASVDSVDVIFRGRSTHGSLPEKGNDPFMEVAEFTLKTQTILGREKPANKPAVISVGSIHGGAAHNIIPDEVKMQLTIRTYDDDVRRLLKKRLVETAFGIAKTAGAPEPTVTFPEEVDATYNDPRLAERMKTLFRSKFGEAVVIDTEPVMGGEDFGQFGATLKAPSLIFWIGERDEKNPLITNHSSKYAPDFTRTAPLAIKAMTYAFLDLNKKDSL